MEGTGEGHRAQGNSFPLQDRMSPLSICVSTLEMDLGCAYLKISYEGWAYRFRCTMIT